MVLFVLIRWSESKRFYGSRNVSIAFAIIVGKWALMGDNYAFVSCKMSAPLFESTPRAALILASVTDEYEYSRMAAAGKKDPWLFVAEGPNASC